VGPATSQTTERGPLTPREHQITELIAEGLSNEQIAERLVLSAGTVANHVAHILAKLGLQSRVQVAVNVAARKTTQQSERVLALLERLRQVDTASLNEALQHAADILAAIFGADNVDAFIYDSTTSNLVALGTSRTAMGDRERALGLHRLPVANGGRAVRIFQDSQPFLAGRVDNDSGELLAVRRELGVRSIMGVPLGIGSMRGVLLVTSAIPDYFTPDQLLLLQFVAYWIGLVARERSTAADS
jgi:DNA-binding CsgD family transcriptional regulator